MLCAEWLLTQGRLNPEVSIKFGAAARYRRATVGSSHYDAHANNSALHSDMKTHPLGGFCWIFFVKAACARNLCCCTQHLYVSKASCARKMCCCTQHLHARNMCTCARATCLQKLLYVTCARVHVHHVCRCCTQHLPVCVHIHESSYGTPRYEPACLRTMCCCTQHVHVYKLCTCAHFARVYILRVSKSTTS